MTEEKKQKTKKVLGIVGNVFTWIFVAFSIVITVMVFAAQNSKDGIPELFGRSIITIESKSMEGTFNKGDLVFLDKLTDEEKIELKSGDIITYKAPIDINGDGKIGDINTHRIVDINNGVIQTKGDNNELNDGYTISYNDVIGVCNEKGRIPGVGAVLSFLRSSLGFFLCIVLPLILFFIYELYRFISLIITERNKNKPVEVSKETEEEIKRKAIEEYLKQQQENKNNEEENKTE